MLKKFKIPIFILAFTILFFTLTASASAEVVLEVSYPVTPEGTLTPESSLPDVIKYIFYFFIIISLLLVVFSLIYGGIIYVSSAGNPDRMGAARKRMIGSVLGLFIILGAFLLLRTINPQLAVLKIEKKPVVGGIILLNDIAFNDNNIKNILKDGTDEQIQETLQELLDAPVDPTTAQARYLSYSITNLEAMFGDLVPWGPGENFEDFKLVALYFLPGTDVKVESYWGKNFQNIVNNPDPDAEYVYPKCSSKTIPSERGPCKFWLIDNSAQHRPPLSLAVIYRTRGVYLHGYPFEREVFVSRDIENLGFEVGQRIGKIEIRNWAEKELGQWEQESKYLAILYENTYFEGQLRIFFEKFTTQTGGVAGTILKEVGNLETNFPDGPVPENEAITDIFEIPPGGGGSKKGITDAYGRVEDPSSIRVFQLQDYQTPDELNCREVRLCTKENFEGECFSYRPSGSSPPPGVTNIMKEDILPIYLPLNVAEKIHSDKDGDGQPDPGGQVPFEDNIRSMKITGNCLVVLFENKIGKHRDTKCVGTKPKDCWDDNTPGSHSTVFEPGNYPKLIDEYPIGQCNCRRFTNRLWAVRDCLSCASAIAIYPVK